MKRCDICGRRIWPWNRWAFKVTAIRRDKTHAVVYYHASCRKLSR